MTAWGFTEEGERLLLSVRLGMRESYEDWQELRRDLIARGLGAPMMIVADGAPGLVKAIEHCWPSSDRQRCCVHRARNLYAKVPERERERVRKAYWQALDDAVNRNDAKQRLLALIDQLDTAGYTAAAKAPTACHFIAANPNSCGCGTTFSPRRLERRCAREIREDSARAGLRGDRPVGPGAWRRGGGGRAGG